MNLTKSLIYLFCALTLASLSAWAQTNVTATSTGIGNWSAASTWNCGAPINGACVPNNGAPASDFYKVAINSGSVGTTGVTVNISPTIDTLTLGSGASVGMGVPGETLTIGSSNNVGSLTNAGEVGMSVAGTTINVGLSSNPNATVMNSAGTFIDTGCYGCGGSNFFQVYGNVSNSGSVFAGYFGGSGNLFNVTGTFTNASGGALTVYGGATVKIGTLANSGNVGVMSGGTLTLANEMTTIASGSKLVDTGNVNGLENLTTVAGTLVVNNGVSGESTTPSGGTLSVTSTGTLGILAVGTGAIVNGGMANSGQVNVKNSASLSVTGTYAQAAGTTTVARTSVLSAGSYTQTGGVTAIDGTLISPTLSITGGTLGGSGTIEGTPTGGGVSVTFSNATFQPSDPMSIPGSLTLDSTDTWNELWSGPSGYGAADVVGTPGTATLGGATLDITTTNFGSLSNGDMFTILDAVNGVSGTFGTINGLDFGSGDSWTIGYTADAVTLTANIPASTTPEPTALLLLGSGLLLVAGLVRHQRVGAVAKDQWRVAQARLGLQCLR